MTGKLKLSMVEIEDSDASKKQVDPQLDAIVLVKTKHTDTNSVLIQFHKIYFIEVLSIISICEWDFVQWRFLINLLIIHSPGY